VIYSQGKKQLNSSKPIILNYNNFPMLLLAHMNHMHHKNKDNLHMESLGKQLIEYKFDYDLLQNFIQKVCNWGGHDGIATRVINQNSKNHLVYTFSEAYTYLIGKQHNAAKALSIINELKHLGRPSFASKHLRFLSPEYCPILDTIIGNQFRLPLNEQGYDLLLQNYNKIARKLRVRKIELPKCRQRKNPFEWYMSDIDMAIFADLKKWQRDQIPKVYS